MQKTSLINREKNHGRKPAKYHYIESVYKVVGYLTIRLTLDGDLQKVYICDDNDPYSGGLS
jgi:hypothetical protein